MKSSAPPPSVDGYQHDRHSYFQMASVLRFGRKARCKSRMMGRSEIQEKKKRVRTNKKNEEGVLQVRQKRLMSLRETPFHFFVSNRFQKRRENHHGEILKTEPTRQAKKSELTIPTRGEFPSHHDAVNKPFHHHQQQTKQHHVDYSSKQGASEHPSRREHQHQRRRRSPSCWKVHEGLASRAAQGKNDLESVLKFD